MGGDLADGDGDVAGAHDNEAIDGSERLEVDAERGGGAAVERGAVGGVMGEAAAAGGEDVAGVGADGGGEGTGRKLGIGAAAGVDDGLEPGGITREIGGGNDGDEDGRGAAIEDVNDVGGELVGQAGSLSVGRQRSTKTSTVPPQTSPSPFKSSMRSTSK